MRVLIDQNISHRVVQLIQNNFPDVVHVRQAGLTDYSDFKIFMYARQNNIDAIFTLDEDFYNILLEHGVPPKIIWLRIGNCSTSILANVINKNAETIHIFANDSSLDILEIFK